MLPLRHALLAAALGLAACADRDPVLDARIDVIGPVAAGHALTWIDRNALAARVLDVGAREASVRTAPVGRDPVLAVARSGAPEVLVLSQGSRGEPGVAPEPGTLTALPVEGAAPRVYRVASPFNALAQTADGRTALAYFRQSGAASRLLFNPNEVALVDLTASPSDRNPALRTVRSFGGVPNGVVFSPAMRVAGRMRTLAVVLSDAYVTLLDLSAPDRAEVTVRLTLPEDTRAVRPEQVLFDTEQATVYVRAQGSNDVYALRLEAAAPASPTANDFRPSINQLAAGQGPSDMALFGDADARRLLVVSPGSRDARVIDARANTTLTLPLDAPASRVLMFTGPAPRDPNAAPRALLYATGGAASAVSFLELTDLAARRGQNVELVRLQRPVWDVLHLPARGALMVSHNAAALSLLDLGRRTVSPIVAEVPLTGATFDGDQQRLWVAPRGLSRMGFIDLRTFGPAELRLDAPVTGVFTLAPTPTRPARVVATHPGAEGAVTVLDGADPRRETARTVRGFLLDGVLDRRSP